MIAMLMDQITSVAAAQLSRFKFVAQIVEIFLALVFLTFADALVWMVQ
jgi:hypothetical protein